MAEQQRSDGDRQPTPAGEHLNRRNLLAALGSAGLLSTAGCLGILGDDETGPRADDPTPVPTTEGGEGTTTGPVETFDIEWTVQGATTAVASNEVLLDVAIDEGLDVPYQCEQGICGVCTSTVPGDGTDYVEHTGADYLSDEQIAGGFVLPCVASPKQDFSIETGKQDAADAYSPDGAETEETTTAADVESFSIDWTVQGATTDVPATQTLLDSALDNDLDVPYECEHGVCGECTSEVPGAGSEYVDHDGNQYLSDEQVEAGYVLTCVGSPKQDFEITTGVKDDADAV
ncbi:2Fe-2S iron-sulfur cluster-binding protein [Halodesulfurarchaeum formicicum]|uniref:2Fe-2S iron-sulfur cluster-binding protein n=1 Tax=Halodesulfurarchaeum formicicum TaxID=1873524 RepID=UPI0009031AB5|nr:2Fe-2S iron-sulfur cluster binding domain-containing protein [Halodesulfurarchaeum formicicum]